ncbi:DUF3035 domain-containing protein [Tropicibacter sp. R16_0]|uniref:DUF3035 domain-containing protein n=1 Tax=Tropicibacter sp. R16_0 TaxID=2821102 RepID=UPI001ADB249D|nr:DUF3035 domain-containing protein [Tropicibacter sp. R16_0]MBO9450634.1 DUF3035 domain-containing protein [Tropicibacter sp. R16_0]
MRTPLGMIALIAVVAASGCSRSDGLKDIRSTGDGPDEFAIMPVKPLTAPSDYAVLPAPTPGGANLTDPNPTADAVVALGGRASALENTGVPSSDSALVAATSRYGVPANTRASLAQEDAEFRKRQGRWTRIKLFPVDRYEQVYRKESLDPYQQTDQFRNSGFGTPSSPPAGE